MKRGEKVFHLHYAIMGFQITYCTKTITVHFSLHENSATSAHLSEEVGLHREKNKRHYWLPNGGKVTSRKTAPLFFFNALEEDSNTALKLFPVLKGD